MGKALWNIMLKKLGFGFWVLDFPTHKLQSISELYQKYRG